MIQRGVCKAVVCKVGSHKDAVAFDTDLDTPLQVRLKNLTSAFTIYAIYTALIICLLLIIMMSIQASTLDTTSGNYDSVTAYVIASMTNTINLTVVLAVVSIPEGLPLAIGVSLAFSVMKMYGDKLLVRKLDAPEKMGSIEEILCGKTGTITTAEMKVAQFIC